MVTRLTIALSVRAVSRAPRGAARVDGLISLANRTRSHLDPHGRRSGLTSCDVISSARKRPKTAWFTCRGPFRPNGRPGECCRGGVPGLGGTVLLKWRGMSIVQVW